MFPVICNHRVTFATKRRRPLISLHDKKKAPVSNATAVTNSIASSAKSDFDGALAIYAENAERSDPTGNYKGKPQLLTELKAWRTAFPDAKSEVTGQISEGNRVATSCTFRGTHTGPFAGATGTIEPTGEHVEIDMETVSWFRGGKIHRVRESFDLAGLMKQLGVAQPKH